METKHELLAPEETAELENTDLKDTMAELKLSLDDSSNKNRNFLMSFLLAQIYLLVTVGGTSDLQLLLPNSVLQLPLVNFSVNMFGFYILAPIFLIAFHFNILFNLREHSRKLSTWTQYNGIRKDTLFLPAFMLNSLTSFKTGQINHSLLRAIIFFIIYFFPMALLGFIQWRFSDYQNLAIGVWHFIAFIIDLCLLTFYWEHIIKPKADDHETEYWSHLKESNFYFGIFWKLLNLAPAFLPILLFFKSDAIARALLESRASSNLDTLLEHNIGLQGWLNWPLKAWRQWPQWPQWPKSVAIAFFIIFVCAAALKWKKLTRQGFWENQKELFRSVYTLPLLWRKEAGDFIPPGGESKRPDLFRSQGLWKRALRRAGALKPANIFAFLITAGVVVNLTILILIKTDNTLVIDKKNSLFNLLTPRIDVSEQRLVQISPDKDIKKDANKKGEPAWLQAYKGLNFNGRNLRLADFGQAELYRADFRGADLRGANFREAQLQGAKLSKADLRETNLAGADLRGAELVRVNLRKAALSGADLRKTVLSGSDLRKAALGGVDLREANLSDVDLRGTTLYSARLRGANLSRADLRETVLYFYRSGGYMYGMKTRGGVRSSDLRETKLIEARLAGTDLTGADLRGADLTKANLGLTTLTQANMEGTVLTEARLRGADLDGAVLKGAKLNFAQLQGASLRNADLSGATAHFVDLQGADLTNANLRAADLNFARLQGANLTGADLRGALLSWSNFYGAAVKRLDVEANLGLINMKRTRGIGFVYMDRDWTSLEDEFSRMENGVRKLLSTDEIQSRLLGETVRGISWKSISKEISKRRTEILSAYKANYISYEAEKILRKLKQKARGAEKRLKKAEERWENFDKKSLKKLKPGKIEDFLKFRRDYLCRNKDLARSVLGQYYAIYRDEKIDLKKALLERMKSKCPAVFREAFPQKNRQTSGIH